MKENVVLWNVYVYFHCYTLYKKAGIFVLVEKDKS